MLKTENQIRELANAIALQAEAIATGRVVGPRYAAVKRLEGNIETLAEWIGDDRDEAVPTPKD
ncbi:hypothetical protein [Nocardia nova]|uniref:hypothetical protein n=1 Tax=Nocardia nova TaxID=37330 RepID=UPI0027388DDA|nr:hypothetical protein [Nocardia nova]